MPKWGMGLRWHCVPAGVDCYSLPRRYQLALAWTATAYPEGNGWCALLQPTPKVPADVHCYSLPRRYQLTCTATAYPEGTGWRGLLQQVPDGVHCYNLS